LSSIATTAQRPQGIELHVPPENSAESDWQHGPASEQKGTLLLQQAAGSGFTHHTGEQCSKDADCAWHAECDESKCEVVPLGNAVGPDALMCCLAFVIAGFSLAAGVGGGGLYVPLLMFVLSFDTRVATALSQAMLFGGAAAAFVYNCQSAHPAKPERPLINYELALLMAPALMGGAQIGSVVHALCPPVLTLALLLVVLSDAGRKAVKSAIGMSAKEAKQEAKQEDSTPAELVEPDHNAELVCSRSKDSRMKLGLIWGLVIALVATKGLLFEMCSPVWWMLSVGTAGLLSGLAWNFATILSEQDPVDEHDIDFRENAFPLVKMSLLAGAVAAMCGIGGGMIMGPILVELKVPPPVSAATTATTLVVLSTSTLLIYICRGIAPANYSMFLSIFTLCGAATGKAIVGWWIRKTGKYSLIVWVLAGVTILSMVLMATQGAILATHDFSDFVSFRNFCGGHIHHTVPATD